MPQWLQSILDTVGAAGAGGGVLALLTACVTVYGKHLERGNARRLEREYRRSAPPGSAVTAETDEPITRQLTTGTVPADESLEERAAFLAKRVSGLLQALDNMREAAAEAAKLADARERALERAKAELQADLDAVRGDLVVARNTVLKLEAAGADLARQLRQAHGLESDAPPAPRTPGSALTVTRRPPRG